jgi:hypothetical protein
MNGIGKSQVFKPNFRVADAWSWVFQGLPEIDCSLAKMIKSHAVSMFQVFLIPLYLLNLYIRIYILYFLLFIYLHTHLQKQQDTYTWYMSCFCDVAFHMPFILPNSVPTGSAWNSVKRQCQSRKRGVDGS